MLLDATENLEEYILTGFNNKLYVIWHKNHYGHLESEPYNFKSCKRHQKSYKMSFINEYLRHTAIYESPGSFWKWSSYATISAILRDHCYLKQGDRMLFSNLYILFLAESSGHRKGPPVDLSETLVNRVNNTKTISGRSSIEAMLDELSKAETDSKTGKVVKSGSAIFYAAEMAAGIVSNPEALKILTDIYDFKNNAYKNRLRTGPCFNIERIVLNMLAGSNEAMLKGLIGVAEIEGGFLARTLLVVPNETREPNSLMRLNSIERSESLTKVYDKLKEISLLKGEFILEEEAIVEYESWYTPFKKAYHNRKEVSGVTGRIHTTVIKIAMVLAANQLRLNVCKCDMEQAINECISLLPNYSVFTMTNSKSELTQASGRILTDLVETADNMLGKKELLRRNIFNGIDIEMLDKILLTLETGGFVSQISTREGVFIKLTPYTLEMLKPVQVVRSSKKKVQGAS